MSDLLKQLVQPFDPKYITWDEEWRPAPGYGGRYEISNLGRVRSYCTSNGEKLRDEPLYHKGHINRGGYLVYDLRLNGKKAKCLAHRLVAAAFLGESALDVNHIDGDKLNNFVGNLEYCTRAENIYHSHYTLGKQMGEDHPHAKLTNEQVMEIHSLLEQGVYQHVIAKRFGISQGHVSMLKNGVRRTFVQGAQGGAL